jgi:hypothetical protein
MKSYTKIAKASPMILFSSVSDDVILAIGHKVRAWWRTDATGAVVLTVRYGAKPIEFAPGKAAIAVAKKEKLISTLETVIAAVEAGELDGVLAQMSKTAVMTKGKRAA